MSSTTRAEHHADSSRYQVRQSRARVRAALERNAVGREKAIHGSTLADLTPLKPTTVRDIIAELRDDVDGPPIGNCSKGYYVIATRDELAEHIESTKDEIQTKQDRLQATVQSFNRERYS
jgi:hypothetical protein